ncbi:MAG: Dabb family protein [Planctomycetota bacterium]
MTFRSLITVIVVASLFSHTLPRVFADGAGAGGEGRVLRHAVFFKFKEGVGDDEVVAIVKAFGELPSQIEAIEAFEWGENISKSGMDGGYTHCFLLTFADEAGRAEYLPHPAHKAFVKLLGGKIETPFVLDYWGKPGDFGEDALRHAVFFRWKLELTEAEVRKMDAEIRAFPESISQIQTFEAGVNVSVEPFDAGFTHCYLVTFADEAALAEYIEHETHMALVGKLEATVKDVRVFDWLPGK